MEGILKDLKLESLILKFALEKTEAENVSGLSDEVLSRLGELRSAIVIVSVPFVLTQQNNISLWLQLLLANAWLFSADEVVLLEGVVVKQNFIRERLGQQVLFV